MTMSGDDHVPKGSRRLEAFTGAGKRRSWPRSQKAAIIAETEAGLESISAVARRHGLAVSQLFAWRRELRHSEHAMAGFVPAVLEPEVPADIEAVRGNDWRCQGMAIVIELELAGVAIRIARNAGSDVITAVIGALRAPR